MEEKKGLIFDIQSYSVHDGPGCRTLVFLSGCPLRCEWCANPEGMEFRERAMFRATKCVHESQGCVRCIEACPHGAVSSASVEERMLDIDIEKCKKCRTLECTEACLNEGFVKSGKWYSEKELMRVFNRDRDFWGRDGGVTFSGGEPLLQKDFVSAMLKRCRESYIHTALETTAHVDQKVLLEIMEYVDFAFIDLKHMDPIKHQEKTGVRNDLILENIAALARSSWPGRLVIRIPIIEGYNDSDENALASAEFLSRLGLKEVNILPFHRLGESKWRQLGMDYPYQEQEPPGDEVLSRVQSIFLDRDILCYVGNDTPF